MTERITNSNASDYVDSRTYNFEDYAKEFAEGEKINKRPYKEIILRDQGNTPYCTRYSSTHISNGQNINEYNANGEKYKQLNPLDIWNKGNKRKFVISALDDAVKLGLIEGYLEIKKDANMIANLDKALSMGLYIATGSYNGLRGNYKKPYDYMVRTDGKILGHAFPIVDRKEDGRYVVPNSFGTDWADRGYFYLKPDQLKHCFTFYAVVDKDDTGKFQILKMKEKAKQFIALAKELYSNGDTEIKEFFEEIQLSNFISVKYGL